MVFLRFEISNDDSRNDVSRLLAGIFSSGQGDWRGARPSRFLGILNARRAGRKPATDSPLAAKPIDPTAPADTFAAREIAPR
jgi:hypothetical protein